MCTIFFSGTMNILVTLILERNWVKIPNMECKSIYFGYTVLIETF